MKKCTHCKELKELSEFYIDNNRPDHIFNKCKDCQRLKYRRQRERNPDTFKKRDKRFYIKHRKEIIKYRLEYYHKNKHKYKAREAVKNALYKGVLTRPTMCSNCKSEGKIQAHHPDYSKPLEVVWLCSRCHMREDFGK